MKRILHLLVCLLLGSSTAHTQVLYGNDLNPGHLYLPPPGGLPLLDPLLPLQPLNPTEILEPTLRVLVDYGYGHAEGGNIFQPFNSGSANHIVFNGLYDLNLASPYALPDMEFFTVHLYNSSATALSTLAGTSLLTVNRVATSVELSAGVPIYRFEGSIDQPFDLVAGQFYYLGISDTENSSSAGYPLGLFLPIIDAIYGNPANVLVHTFDSGSYSTNSVSLPFELSHVDVVPEPSSWALGLVGLGILGWCSWRGKMRTFACISTIP